MSAHIGNNQKQKTLMYKALESKYTAEANEALATINVYLNNPAGIGEHPQVIEELAKQLEKLANAEDALNTLKENQKTLMS